VFFGQPCRVSRVVLETPALPTPASPGVGLGGWEGAAVQTRS